MAENGGSEKSGLFGKSIKSQAKYGTTTKSTYTNDTFFKHFVQKSETIQGIALKHGVTVEQINRANNIWANDSLFLREYLLIPLPKSATSGDSQPLANGSVSNGNSATFQNITDLEIVTRQELQAASKQSKAKSVNSSDKESVPPVVEKDSVKDFLSRMDSSLAQIKHKVHDLDSTSDFPEDMTNPLNHLPNKKTSVYGRRRTSSRNSMDSDIIDPTTEPQLVFRSSQRDRQVKSSLEHLERTQDDMFQL